jgi:hypothetical protein
VLFTDLIRLGSNLIHPPAKKELWIEKQTMVLSLPHDLSVTWKAALVEQQVKAAAELLRGKLFKRANGLGTRTVLAYLDTETKQYLTLDLDGFISWLGSHFILIEFTSNIQWGFPNRCFAAKLYDQAISNQSSLQWIK